MAVARCFALLFVMMFLLAEMHCVVKAACADWCGQEFGASQEQCAVSSCETCSMCAGEWTCSKDADEGKAALAAGCPSSKWTLSKATGLCLFRIPGAMTHQRCVCMCKELNASIACVRSQAANDELMTVGVCGENAGSWIGYFQATNDGPWEWVCGDEGITYTNWNSNEPNNYCGTGQCENVGHFFRNKGGKWNDDAAKGGSGWSPGSCLCEYAPDSPGAKISESYAKAYLAGNASTSCKDVRLGINGGISTATTTKPSLSANCGHLLLTLLLSTASAASL